MSYIYSHKFSRIESNKELIEILECDDRERFLPLLSERFLPLLSAYDNDCLTLFLVGRVAKFHAKNCLLALIQGEGCESVLELYARTAPHNPQIPTPLASVTSTFHEAYDIIALLLKRGPVDHPNIMCNVHPRDVFNLCPLDRLLFHLSRLPHLLPWNHCSSIVKLIILLCQSDTKSRLDCARLLVPHTHGLNDIAWTYVMQGNLAALGGLLLVAPDTVLLPKVSGFTIRERIMRMVDMLKREDNLDDNGAVYKSMLTNADFLIDIFEKAGGALSLYCSLMHENVPPHKVIADVASLLKKAGYALEPRDLDLRDCYRDCTELRKPGVFKLSDPGSPNKKYLSPSSLTPPQGSRATLQNYPYHGNCLLLNKIKSGPVLSFRPSAGPRLLSTVARHVEHGVPGILQKHLAYIAFKLKRGIKF